MPCRGLRATSSSSWFLSSLAKPSSRYGSSILQAQPNQAKPFTQQGFAKYRG